MVSVGIVGLPDVGNLMSELPDVIVVCDVSCRWSGGWSFIDLAL